VLWDCKLTPAYCVCQEGNTTGCISSNDGLGAGVPNWFSTAVPAPAANCQWACPLQSPPRKTAGPPNSGRRVDHSQLTAGAVKPDLDRAKAGGRVAAVGERLGRFAGEVRRERERASLASAQGPELPGGFVPGRSFVLRRSIELLGNLVLGWSLVGSQRHIDILEDLPGRDAENAVARFDKIVAFASGVLPAEKIDEGEAGGELLGFDQKAGAIGDPWVGRFHECLNSVPFSSWFSIFR
jgi:hypothetical protein